MRSRAPTAANPTLGMLGICTFEASMPSPPLPTLHCDCGDPLRCLDSSLRNRCCAACYGCLRAQTDDSTRLRSQGRHDLPRQSASRSRPRFHRSSHRPTSHPLLQGRRLPTHDGGARTRRDRGWTGALTSRRVLRPSSHQAKPRARTRDRRVGRDPRSGFGFNQPAFQPCPRATPLANLRSRAALRSNSFRAAHHDQRIQAVAQPCNLEIIGFEGRWLPVRPGSASYEGLV